MVWHYTVPVLINPYNCELRHTLELLSSLTHSTHRVTVGGIEIGETIDHEGAPSDTSGESRGDTNAISAASFSSSRSKRSTIMEFLE